VNKSDLLFYIKSESKLSSHLKHLEFIENFWSDLERNMEQNSSLEQENEVECAESVSDEYDTPSSGSNFSVDN